MEEELMSAEIEKQLIELKKLLEQERANKKKLKKALARAKVKELEDNISEFIGESGNAYLDAKKESAELKEIKQKFKDEIKQLKQKYSDGKARLDEIREGVEANISEKEAEIVDAKTEFDEHRKEEFVQNYEKNKKKNIREINSLKSKLSKAENKDEADSIQSKIDGLKKQNEDNERAFLSTDAGQKYKSLKAKVEGKQLEAKLEKDKLTKLDEIEEDMDEKFDMYCDDTKKRAKEAKALVAPEKKNKLQLLLGKIRAKLAIGKYNDEKNMKESIKKAMDGTRDLVGKIAKTTEEVGKEAVNWAISFGKNRKQEILKSMEQHYQKRVEKAQAKLENVQSKLNPDSPEPSR